MELSVWFPRPRQNRRTSDLVGRNAVTSENPCVKRPSDEARPDETVPYATGLPGLARAEEADV